jgi:hypothetical protein
MKKIICAAAATVLASCGGGGGGGDVSAPAPTTSHAVGAAWSALLAGGRAWTATGVGSDGAAYTFTISVTNQGSGTLGGAAANKTDIGIVTKRNGATTTSPVTGLIYEPTAKTVMRLLYADGDCGIPSASTAVPASAVIGASGSLYRATIYSGCSSLTNGAEVSTWSVEWSGQYPMLCINTDTTSRYSTLLNVFQAVCIEITEAGVLGDRARVTYRSSSVTVNPG